MTEQSDDLYDLIDFILYNSERTHLDEIVYGLSQVEFGDSYAELTIGVDESGKIMRASFALDYEQRNADPSDHYYVQEMRIQIEGTVTVSYDAFRLEAPSEDQMAPVFGEPQIDEEAGTIFIPVEWNCAEPGEAYADVDLSFDAWSEEGYVGSGSFDVRNLPIEQTQEGIFLDVSLTESWEGLRQTIDQLLADDYDVPFSYEIFMWIEVTLNHEYQNFEGIYFAEGDEIYDTQITFEGPWIIW